MANTYSQSYMHLIFAVRNRNALILDSWASDLEKYITGIVQAEGHKLIAIGTAHDHIHIFIGYNLNNPIPKLVEQIKTSSNKWIKDKKLCPFHFSWQNGYACFTHSHSQIDRVAKYVLNQREHHIKKSFKDEYLSILKKNDIKFEENYLFDFFEE
ncbi:IS200/IS605 family transposase [Marinifilum caeruleilacunae]|uniref:IS200/IS605 family transposase n=1 Tax=Marinifilum caeruleilacunae TaxID=2499076 RepID=A0ABX1WTC2_9BACT|nr:IS200/IS605 family transposase [Marinifilum caeruleilacunae]NOU59327.1 IS200/IS605 family transposase [Marinifilum caeruleilacunae]